MCVSCFRTDGQTYCHASDVTSVVVAGQTEPPVVKTPEIDWEGSGVGLLIANYRVLLEREPQPHPSEETSWIFNLRCADFRLTRDTVDTNFEHV